MGAEAKAAELAAARERLEASMATLQAQQAAAAAARDAEARRVRELEAAAAEAEANASHAAGLETHACASTRQAATWLACSLHSAARLAGSARLPLLGGSARLRE